jgi:hypothetical protein
MNTVIIPCAGSNTRWGRSYPKQMAQIGKESIIQRLVRQCHAVGNVPYILTNNDTLIPHLPLETIIHNPVRCRWLVETLISSHWHWQGRVVILLGDVIFHQRCFDWIWSDGRPLQFYGNVHELFALAFTPSATHRIFNAMHVALVYAEQHPEDSGAGKLWSVYKAFRGVPQSEAVTNMDYHFTHINDSVTTDIDSVNEYETFLQDVIAAGLLDEVMT